MRFKLVGCLSTAFIYFISINSVAAIDIVSKQGSQSNQTIATNPVRVIEREQRRLEREQRKKEREERMELRRHQREQQRVQRQQELERRQKELEAARRAATEEQRLEAERRRQYFENLSPEDKKAYLAEQEAQRVRSNKAAALFLLMLMNAGGAGSSQQDNSQKIECHTWDDYANAGSRKCR